MHVYMRTCAYTCTRVFLCLSVCCIGVSVRMPFPGAWLLVATGVFPLSRPKRAARSQLCERCSVDHAAQARGV